MDLAALLVGRERVDGYTPSSPHEKALLLAAAWALVFGSYYLVGLTVDPARAISLHTPLDDAVPFLPEMMWVYEGVYTAGLFPVFLIRCRHLFRRVILGYSLIAVVSMVVWVALPVTSVGLRPDASALDMTVFHNWGLRVNYALDPPINLFPSLHVAATLLAAACAWQVHRTVGAIALTVAFVVAVAVCAVKQHFVLDVAGGVLVGGAAYWFMVRPYDSGGQDERVTYTWRGPLAYLALHGAVVLSFLGGFLMGWSPWTYPGTF